MSLDRQWAMRPVNLADPCLATGCVQKPESSYLDLIFASCSLFAVCSAIFLPDSLSIAASLQSSSIELLQGYLTQAFIILFLSFSNNHVTWLQTDGATDVNGRAITNGHNTALFRKQKGNVSNGEVETARFNHAVNGKYSNWLGSGVRYHESLDGWKELVGQIGERCDLSRLAKDRMKYQLASAGVLGTVFPSWCNARDNNTG